LLDVLRTVKSVSNTKRKMSL